MRTNGDSADGIVDTGLGGGTMFEFAWESDDPLSKHIAPLKYSRVDIDFGGDALAQGVIMGVEQAVHQETQEEVDGTWILKIAVGGKYSMAVAAAVAGGNVAIRVLS
jgi:hypothetical protein